MGLNHEVWVECDVCGNLLDEKYPSTTRRHAEEALVAAGWDIDGYGYVTCPNCPQYTRSDS